MNLHTLGLNCMIHIYVGSAILFQIRSLETLQVSYSQRASDGLTWFIVFIEVQLRTTNKLKDFLGALRRIRKIAISVTSVCPSAWSNSAPTGWTFIKFDIWVFFLEKSVKKFQVSSKSHKNDRYFMLRPVYRIMITARYILLIIRDVLAKRCR